MAVEKSYMNVHIFLYRKNLFDIQPRWGLCSHFIRSIIIQNINCGLICLLESVSCLKYYMELDIDFLRIFYFSRILHYMNQWPN